ncbi:peroxidase-related enzyme [Actinoplanes sp. NBRC 101535]|uniref:peroxidase-related enzyme n=1 Tax=Actinoplanes sp. NBRC 101535 TaxID=3032196 RepID=UPI0024A16F34|nr:peroxidase-related enzyme [Actinoplanes sp. NBRC 101535]GLY03797.1 hypothetical protein Acsp01_41760 [Actinoplanes sp. NBRC 101535]
MPTADRTWVHQAIRAIEADTHRTGTTPLRLFPLPADWGIRLYLKDETVQPTGSVQHRTARSLIRFGLANGDIGPGTTLVRAGGDTTAAALAYFARLLDLDFVAVVPRDTPAAVLDLIRRHGGRLHPADSVSAAAIDLGTRPHWYVLDGRPEFGLDDLFDQLALEPHPEPTWLVLGADATTVSAPVGRRLRLQQRPTLIAATVDAPLVDEVVTVSDSLGAALRLIERMRRAGQEGSVVALISDEPAPPLTPRATSAIPTLVGDDPLAALGTLRDDVRASTLALDDLVLRPVDERGLSRTDRLRIALRVAQVNDHRELAAHWTAELGGDAGPVGDPSHWAGLGPRAAGILAHAEQMALDPRDLGRDDVHLLGDLGLDAPQTVAVAQVVAYVSYLVRLLRGLAALDENPDTTPAPPRVVGSEPQLAASEPPHFTATLRPDETEFPVYRWDPWVPPARVPGVEPGSDSRTPAKWSPFYLTLLHDPAVLAERTALYNAIMTGSPGVAGALGRADRELAALGTSLVTGCEYCASVHGRRQIQLSGDTGTSVLLAQKGPSVLGDPLQQAVVALAAHTATTPPTVGAGDVTALREAGLGDDAIRDALAVAAMFAWANRLMMTLGEAVL